VLVEGGELVAIDCRADRRVSRCAQAKRGPGVPKAFTTISPIRETGWYPSISERRSVGSEGPMKD